MSEQYARIYNAKTTTGLRPGKGDKEFFSADLLPTSDIQYDIGNPNLRWKTFYTYNTVTSNNLAVGENLSAKNASISENLTVTGTMAIGDIDDTIITDYNEGAVVANRTFVTPRIHSTSYITSPFISTMGFAQVDKFYASRTTDASSKIDPEAAVKIDGGVAIGKRAWADAFQADTEVVTPLIRSVGGTTSIANNLAVSGMALLYSY